MLGVAKASKDFFVEERHFEEILLLVERLGKRQKKRWWSEDQGTRRRQPKCQRTVGFGPPKTPKPERKAVNCVRTRRRPFTKAVEIPPHAVRRRSGGCDCDRAATTPSSPSNTVSQIHFIGHRSFASCKRSCNAIFAERPNCGRLMWENYKPHTSESCRPRGVSNQKILDNYLPFGESIACRRNCRRIKLSLCFRSLFRVGVVGQKATHKKPSTNTTPPLPKKGARLDLQPCVENVDPLSVCSTNLPGNAADNCPKSSANSHRCKHLDAATLRHRN